MNDFYNGKITDIAELNPSESVAVGSSIKKIPMEFVQTFNRKITGFEISNYKSGPKFRNYDTLLAKITPCLENGKTAYVDVLNKDEIAFGSSEFIVLRPKNLADKEFLYYFAISPIFRKRAISSMEGTSGRKRVNETTLKNHVFKIPNQLLRTSIGSVLASIDTKIELNQKINIELEQMAKMIYDYWFVQFEFPNKNNKPYTSSGGKMIWNEELKREIPQGWNVGNLLDIANYVNGLACQKYRPKDNEDKLRVIKIKEIHEGFSSETEFVSSRIPEKVIIENGDVLFSWSASLEVVLWAGGKGALNQHIFKITSNKYPKSFYYFQLLNYLSHFKMMAENRKTTMGHITQEHLEQSRIVLPPLELTCKLEEYISPFLSMIVKNEEENQRLKDLRDWLLPMLMNGQVKIKPISES